MALAVALFVVVAACSGPRTQRADVDQAAVERERQLQAELALNALYDHTRRLADVAFAIRHNAAALCGTATEAYFGLSVQTRHAFEAPMRRAAETLFAADDRLRVWTVAAGSPAGRAGLLPGDVIMSVNDTEIPSGTAAISTFIGALDAYSSDTGDGPVSVVFDRADVGLRRAEMVPVTACAYPAELLVSDEINAFADGQHIVVTTGMMNFLRDDTELATIVGHELAHNVMGHVEARQTNALGGLFFDLLAAGLGVNTQGAFSQMAAQAYSQDFELEADYVGLYALALAGYDYERAPNIWRQIAILNPDSITIGRSHPTTAERFIGLENTVAELNQKIASGLPLEPEIKSGSGFGDGSANTNSR
ncbi:MAG: M48 family metallopeptidase [Alphaproteobacteria bacterium]